MAYVDHDIVLILRSAINLKDESWQDLAEDAAAEIIKLRRRVERLEHENECYLHESYTMAQVAERARE
jgi:hypothetical protein